MRFIMGLVVGLLALGGYLAFDWWQSREDPCRGHCGEGTHCVDGQCAPMAASRSKQRVRRRRGGSRRRHRRGVAEKSDRALREPSRGQLAVRTVGPKLDRPQRVDFSEAGQQQRELSESEITARVRGIDGQIIGCIDTSRQGYVWSGKIVVGLRIGPSGAIEGVQVRAPALLIERGLHACVRKATATLRFPSSSRAVVVRYPYAFDI